MEKWRKFSSVTILVYLALLWPSHYTEAKHQERQDAQPAQLATRTARDTVSKLDGARERNEGFQQQQPQQASNRQYNQQLAEDEYFVGVGIADITGPSADVNLVSLLRLVAGAAAELFSPSSSSTGGGQGSALGSFLSNRRSSLMGASHRGQDDTREQQANSYGQRLSADSKVGLRGNQPLRGDARLPIPPARPDLRDSMGRQIGGVGQTARLLCDISRKRAPNPEPVRKGELHGACMQGATKMTPGRVIHRQPVPPDKWAERSPALVANGTMEGGKRVTTNRGRPQGQGQPTRLGGGLRRKEQATEGHNGSQLSGPLVDFSDNAAASPSKRQTTVSVNELELLSFQYPSWQDLENFKLQFKVNLRSLLSYLQGEQPTNSLQNILFRWAMPSQIRMQVEYTYANFVVRL